jgi:hypothetical protein
LKQDVDRAELRQAKSEEARMEADQRYNQMVEKFRDLQSTVMMEGVMLSP